jgi:LacI family transcriptional regulator
MYGKQILISVFTECGKIIINSQSSSSMANTPKKIRIVDIALMAGVSPGTVDRVLHNRGEVAEESRKKIMSIIEKHNYQPNIIARSLSMRKTLCIVSLLPEYRPGDYWEAPERGIRKAEAEIRNYNVVVEKMYFNQFDVQSFKDASGKLLSNKPDAVLLAPTFRNEAVELMQQLRNGHIPAVYIDSNVEDEYYLSYFGQDSYRSGYVAAQLLQSGLACGSAVIVGRTARTDGISNQSRLREEGFTAYFKEMQLTDKYQFIHVGLSVDNEAENTAEIEKAIKRSSGINAAIVFNSRVYQLADTFKKLKVENVKLIGYDLSGDNISYLKSGAISYLIAQRPEDQGYRGIMSLCSHLVFSKDVKRINYAPIDILIKENIDYYVDYD